MANIIKLYEIQTVVITVDYRLTYGRDRHAHRHLELLLGRTLGCSRGNGDSTSGLQTTAEKSLLTKCMAVSTVKFV